MVSSAEITIPYGRQTISREDVDAVVSVLQSDFLTQGPMVPRFESAIADRCAVPHAVAVNSATSALHIACLALDLGPGDILWTSPITFVASANCGLYCGAEVDFVDIDPITYNLSPAALQKKLITAQKENRLPKVVVAVHLCGQPCDMAAIHALSRQFGFRIIEDASHAIGSAYRNAPVGNCRYSDITVFSFHPVKIITSGEGGMALTADANLARRMTALRSHGITRDPDCMTRTPDGPWYYEQVDLGFNYRMTDLQAALGLSQLRRLQEFIRRRDALAKRYDTLLADLPVVLPWQHPDGFSARHLYVIRIHPEKSPGSRSRVFDFLKNKGIGVNLHYIPVHTQPWYRKMGFQTGDFPMAEQYAAEAITLPLYPDLTDHQQQIVIDALREVLS